MVFLHGQWFKKHSGYRTVIERFSIECHKTETKPKPFQKIAGYRTVL